MGKIQISFAAPPVQVAPSSLPHSFINEDRIILMSMQRHRSRRMLELWLRAGVKKETMFTTFWSVLSVEGGTKKRQVLCRIATMDQRDFVPELTLMEYDANINLALW